MTAKVAVLGFTRHLAFELGHFKIEAISKFDKRAQRIVIRRGVTITRFRGEIYEEYL